MHTHSHMLLGEIYRHYENILELPKQSKRKLPFHLAIPAVGIHLWTVKSLHGSHSCLPRLSEALHTIAKVCNQPTCPSTDEGMKELQHTDTTKYAPSTNIDDRTSIVATQINLEDVIFNGISEAGKDKHRIISPMRKLKII